MATITPTFDSAIPTVRVVTWETIATGDTINSVTPDHDLPAIGTVTITGTFGGATVTLEGSNDNSNWFTLKNVQGSSVSATAAAMFEISTAALYIRPAISGGTGDDVDVILAMRG